MSRGLFHSAIAQSGSVTDYWNLNTEPKVSAQKVAKVLGIDTDDSKKLVDELKKRPATDIALATIKLYFISVIVFDMICLFITQVFIIFLFT